MAKKRKKRNSAIRESYNRNRNRIIAFIRRAEKRGFYFDEDVLPPIPKRITKEAVRRLEKLTPDALYRKSVWVDIETGEFMSGRRRAEQERSEKSRRAYQTRRENKAAEAAFFEVGEEHAATQQQTQNEPEYPDLYEIAFDNVFDDFLAKMSAPTPDYFYNVYGRKLKKMKSLTEATKEAKSDIVSFLNDLLSKKTKSEIGKVIADNYDQIEMHVNYILFGSDATMIANSAIKVMSIIKGGLTKEENQKITEETEYWEDWEEP